MAVITNFSTLFGLFDSVVNPRKPKKPSKTIDENWNETKLEEQL